MLLVQFFLETQSSSYYQIYFGFGMESLDSQEDFYSDKELWLIIVIENWRNWISNRKILIQQILICYLSSFLRSLNAIPITRFTLDLEQSHWTHKKTSIQAPVCPPALLLGISAFYCTTQMRELPESSKRLKKTKLITKLSLVELFTFLLASFYNL